jgi:predicted small secreted protein
MRKVRQAVALAAAIALASCQTLDGVRINGQDVSPNRVNTAQGNFGFCETNPFVCVLLGIAVVGGAAWLIWGDDDDDDDSESPGL